MLCFVLNKYLEIFLKSREKRSELKSIFQVGQVFEDPGSTFLPWLAEKGQRWQVGWRVPGGGWPWHVGEASVSQQSSPCPQATKTKRGPWDVVGRGTDGFHGSRGEHPHCVGPCCMCVGSYAPSFARRTHCKGRGAGQSPLETRRKLPLPCGQL